MKRFLAAWVVAIGLHGLLFVADDNWLIRQSKITPKTEVISLRLVSHTPSTLAMNPLPDAPPPLPPSPKPATEPKPAVKPKPKATPKPVEKKNKPIAKKQPEKKVPPPPPTPSPPTPLPSVSEPEPDTNGATPPEAKKTATETDVNVEPVRSAPAKATVIQATPRYNRNPPPTYPRIARKRGYEGTVVLDVFVKKDGNVGDLRILETSGYKQLDQSAKRSVKAWQFKPGKKGGKTAAMWVRVPVTFQLK